MADKNKMFFGTNKDTYIAADDAGNIILQTEHGSRTVLDTEGMKVGVNGAEPVALGAGGSSFVTLEEEYTPAGSIGEASTFSESVAGVGGADYFDQNPQYFQSGRVFFSGMDNDVQVGFMLRVDSPIFDNTQVFQRTTDFYGNNDVNVINNYPSNISFSNFNDYFDSNLISTADNYGNAALSFDGHVNSVGGAYTGTEPLSTVISNMPIFRIDKEGPRIELGGVGFVYIIFRWNMNDVPEFDSMYFGDKSIPFTEARSGRQEPFVIYFQSPATSEVSFTGGNIIMSGLPTQDPAVPGALYNDYGVLRISTGNAGP